MDRIAVLLGGEDGEFYRQTGLFAEKFIDGPEFTVFVVSDKTAPIGARAYPPVQRLFHKDLPAHERFLSFDRYWSEFKEESRLSPDQPFYRYGIAPEHLSGRLADLATRAYVALEGRSYGRVDIRLDEETDELFVLEVNANCGLSGDTETSVGEMLCLTKIPVTTVITEMLQDAYDRAVAGGYRPAGPSVA
jgi:D-alanine-D-alanine ligase